MLHGKFGVGFVLCLQMVVGADKRRMQTARKKPKSQKWHWIKLLHEGLNSRSQGGQAAKSRKALQKTKSGKAAKSTAKSSKSRTNASKNVQNPKPPQKAKTQQVWSIPSGFQPKASMSWNALDAYWLLG